MRLLLILFLIFGTYTVNLSAGEPVKTKAQTTKSVKNPRTMKVTKVGQLKQLYPGLVYFSVISDTEYIYFFVKSPEPALTKYVGKTLKFSGTATLRKLLDTSENSTDTILRWGKGDTIFQHKLQVDTNKRYYIQLEDYTPVK